MDIRVYRISTCHWCDKVESFLKRHGVDYRSIVIDLLSGDEQEKAIAEAYHISKQRSFPVIYIDGSCIIGFHESRLRHLLNLSDDKEENKVSGLKNAGHIPGVLFEEKDHSGTVTRMRQWLEGEASSHGYKVNPDQQVVEEILIGLARNEKRYGYKTCPCRLATGRYQLDCDIVCPCSYCFLDVEKSGRCYCTLFVSDRFISGDISLPQYVPDSRYLGAVEEKGTDIVKEKPRLDVVPAPALMYKTYIKAVGFIQDSADKDKAKNNFLKILKSLALSASGVQWNEGVVYADTTTGNMRVFVRFKQDADVYSYQLGCMSVDGKMINGDEIFRGIDYLEQKNKLFECDIVETVFDFTEKNLRQYLREKIFTSSVYNKGRIAAGFEAEGACKDTFVIMNMPEDSVRQRIVEDIVTLETNYYLLNVEKQRYILADGRLELLDSAIVSKMTTISMNLSRSHPETLKDWLHGLSNNFGEISGIAEESRHRMNYTILKRDVIRRIFKDWDENNTGLEYPPISKFFLERVDSLGDQYQHLFMRMDGIRREMVDLITILRTKIDLVLQEQSLELQRSMDETTKTQMIMQHTVEGLSVIVLSYYTIHLAGFILESLEASHIIHVSLTTAKAIFVPIAIAISWYLTFRARQFVKRHSRKSK